MRTETTPPIILHWQKTDDTESCEWHWLIVDKDLRGQSSESLRAALSQSNSANNQAPQRREAILLISAECALMTRVFVPSSRPAHIRAAVPHLIEEATLAESDSLHLSIGDRAEDGYVAVTVIDRELMTQVLADAESPLYACDAIYCDAELLPYAPNTLTLLIDRDRALFRWSATQAGAIETQALIPFVSALCRRHAFGAINLLSTVNTAADQVVDIEQRLTTSIQNITQRITRHEPVLSVPHYCATQLTTQPRLTNLRQGEFAPQHAESVQWRRWRPVAIAAAICLIIQVGFNAIAGWRFTSQANAIHAQSEQIYRELFPADKRIVNLRQQFQNHLSNGAEANQLAFFELFGVLSKEIQNTVTQNPIQLRSLLYDKKVGTLQVELTVPSVQTLDNLQKRLSANALKAKVTSAANSDGVVIGRLNLAGKS